MLICRKINKAPKTCVFGAFGIPGAIRTRDLSLRRRTLYPAELRRHMWLDCGGLKERGKGGIERLPFFDAERQNLNQRTGSPRNMFRGVNKALSCAATETYAVG